MVHYQFFTNDQKLRNWCVFEKQEARRRRGRSSLADRWKERKKTSRVGFYALAVILRCRWKWRKPRGLLERRGVPDGSVSLCGGAAIGERRRVARVGMGARVEGGAHPFLTAHFLTPPLVGIQPSAQSAFVGTQFARTKRWWRVLLSFSISRSLLHGVTPPRPSL